MYVVGGRIPSRCMMICFCCHVDGSLGIVSRDFDSSRRSPADAAVDSWNWKVSLASLIT